MSVNQRVDYHSYMASREWAQKKEAVKKRSKGVCERCHDAPHQDTHHLTYERLGNEDIEEDLLGLCRPCHEWLSAKREADPAIEVLVQLINEHGLKVVSNYPLPFDAGYISPPMWEVGPTRYGRFFNGYIFEGSSSLAMGDPYTLIVPLGYRIEFVGSTDMVAGR